jgi:zinc protease
MFKKILFALSMLLLLDYRVEARIKSSFHKLDNGVSVIFVDTVKSDSIWVVLCVSAGSTDELDQDGVANLLTYMFTEKLQLNANTDALQHGSEISSRTDYDKSIYYYYGNAKSLEGFIKNVGQVFRTFSFSTDDMNANKNKIEQSMQTGDQVDKRTLHRESRSSIYWHSKYGAEITGDSDSLAKISNKDVLDFKNNNYTNNRATLVVAGNNVDKDATLAMVTRYFEKKGRRSVINRPQEPSHHGETVRIVKHSQQISVPLIEMYWRVPNYRTDRNGALGVEIFVNYLLEALRKNLIDEQKIAASIEISHAFWNYDCGDFSIIITSRNLDNVDEVITTALSEIKYIAFDGISREQANKAAAKIMSPGRRAQTFPEVAFGDDTLDAIDWITQRVGSGLEFDFLKGYADFSQKYNLENINTRAKDIFKNDPCVISIIKPLKKKSPDGA